MVERSGSQRLRNAAFYLLITITGVIAVSALVLAVLAVCQIKALQVPSTTLLLSSGLMASSTNSSSSGITVLETQHANLMVASSSSTHDWSTTSHPTTPLRARTSSTVLVTDASSQPSQDINPRNEGVTFGAPAKVPCTVEVTVTTTSTIHLACEVHSASMQPRDLTAVFSRLALGLFGPPPSGHKARRMIAPTTDATRSATASEEKLSNCPTANAAAPRLTLPWPRERKRGMSTPPTRNFTYWEAYSTLRNQAVQLCFAKATYLNTSSIRNAEDHKLATQLDVATCQGDNTVWQVLTKGGRCDSKNEWIDIMTKVQALCQGQRIGQILKQSVDLLCTVREQLARSVDNCEGETPGNGTKSLAATPSTDSIASSTLTSISTIATTTTRVDPTTTIVNNAGSASISLAPGTLFAILTPVAKPLAPDTSNPPPIISQSAPIITPLLPGQPSLPLLASACSPTILQLTYSTPAKWSTPIITSILSPPASPNWQGLPSYGISPSAPIPCGYTPTFFTLIVPATTITGDMTHYSGQDAFINPPACEAGGMLQHDEAMVAISYQLFDFGRAGAITGPSAFCGRKIVAWCDTDEGDGGEVELWVRDRCTGCRAQDLDVLEEGFPFCGTDSKVGRAAVSWKWAEDR